MPPFHPVLISQTGRGYPYSLVKADRCVIESSRNDFDNHPPITVSKMKLIPLRSLLVLAFAAATFPLVPAASGQEEVAKGSKLRKELFELARPDIKAVTGRDVLFNGSMKRQGNWAFFRGNIVTADGRPIRVGPGESGDTALLWSLKNGVWFLMEAEVGFTDVIYLEWSDKHGFPGALTGS